MKDWAKPQRAFKRYFQCLRVWIGEGVPTTIFKLVKTTRYHLAQLTTNRYVGNKHKGKPKLNPDPEEAHRHFFQTRMKPFPLSHSTD